MDPRLSTGLSVPLISPSNYPPELALLVLETRRGTVAALAEAVMQKDRSTGGHGKRVVFWAEKVGRAMGLSDSLLEELRWAAVLHDVGKLGIEDRILKKAAPLAQDEWPLMKSHPERGREILRRAGAGLGNVEGAVLHHHERWDGEGYPDRLRGEEIPLFARIVSVVDAYDAMISNRPYRKGMDPVLARSEIATLAGSQFCPSVVDAFLSLG